MDTNPFANNQSPSNYQTPDYLKQTNNGTAPGVMSNMVKALMDGNNKYQQRQGAGGSMAPTGDGQWYGNSSVGGAPLAGYSANPPAGQVTPAMNPTMSSGGSPFDQGTSALPYTGAPGMMASAGGQGMPGLPNGSDPTINALFSPIPGGQFGG